MRRFYEGNDNKGYQEVVDKEAGLELIGFDLIRLELGENAVYESGEYEIGLVILQGTCSVKVMMSHLTSLAQEEACLTASQQLFMFQEILSMKLQQPEA